MQGRGGFGVALPLYNLFWRRAYPAPHKTRIFDRFTKPCYPVRRGAARFASEEKTMTASTSQAPRARSCLGILLAAGEGVRMRSARAKPLHEVAGRSMLAHALKALIGAGAERIAVVVGPGADAVAAEARRQAAEIEIHVQSERRGTAHAVLAAR